MKKYDKASLYAELDSQLKKARLRSTNVQLAGFAVMLIGAFIGGDL